MTIYNFSMLNVPFANGAISTEIAPFPDWNRGLGIAFDQTEGKPEMKGLNGLFQVLTTSMLYLKQRGIAEWDSTLEYPANAFVTEGAKLYKSKRINTAKRPSTSQLDWDVWASISDISVSTNGNLKKTVAAGGGVTLEVPTASDTQRGVVRQATSTEVANKSNVNAYITPANALSITNTSNAATATTAANCSRSIAAGNGLSGGGALNADRTLTLGTPSTITASTTNSTTSTSHTHDLNIDGFFQGTKSTNGYQRLPGGLILQWGTVDYSSNPGEIAVDVVFPLAFPTSCLNVTATRKSLANNFGDGVVSIVSYSRSSAKFQFNTWDTQGVSGLRGFTWFAIGY